MKIAFDFDGTLSKPYIQKMAQKFIDDGHDVFIITSRAYGAGKLIRYDNSDLEKVADRLGIDRRIYTAGELKLCFLPDDTDILFDDDMVEVEEVNTHMENTVAICSRPMKDIVMSPQPTAE